MNRLRLVGAGLTLLGGGGYVVGVLAPYPGRAFAITLVMVGVTLLATGWNGSDETGGGEVA